MAGIFHPSRGGGRGGQDQFSWDDVKTDKDRENYLGHSVMAPVGKWQEGKDLTWYTKDKRGKFDEDEKRRKELDDVKSIEARAMAAALGHKSYTSTMTTSLTAKELQDVLARHREIGNQLESRKLEEPKENGSHKSKKKKEKKKKKRKEKKETSDEDSSAEEIERSNQKIERSKRDDSYSNQRQHSNNRKRDVKHSTGKRNRTRESEATSSDDEEEESRAKRFKTNEPDNRRERESRRYENSRSESRNTRELSHDRDGPYNDVRTYGEGDKRRSNDNCHRHDDNDNRRRDEDDNRRRDDNDNRRRDDNDNRRLDGNDNRSKIRPVYSSDEEGVANEKRYTSNHVKNKCRQNFSCGEDEFEENRGNRRYERSTVDRNERRRIAENKSKRIQNDPSSSENENERHKIIKTKRNLSSDEEDRRHSRTVRGRERDNRNDKGQIRSSFSEGDGNRAKVNQYRNNKDNSVVRRKPTRSISSEDESETHSSRKDNARRSRDNRNERIDSSSSSDDSEHVSKSRDNREIRNGRKATKNDENKMKSRNRMDIKKTSSNNQELFGSRGRSINDTSYSRGHENKEASVSSSGDDDESEARPQKSLRSQPDDSRVKFVAKNKRQRHDSSTSDE